MNVLMIGPALDIKGGMSTVISSYLDSEIKNVHKLSFLPSISGSSIFQKAISEQVGFLKFFLKLKKTDLVHIHMASRRSTFRKMKYIELAYRKKKKIVLHIHGGGFGIFFEKCSDGQKANIIKTLNKCDKIIVLTKEWQDYFSRIIEPKKIAIIHNGTVLQQFIRKEFNHDFCFAGRLVKEKGIFELVEAFTDVLKQYPEAKLFIAGDGEDKMALKNKVLDLKISDSVKFLGWINREKLKELFEKCTFNVVPSYFEAFSMTIIEAMSFGQIVIASNVGGIPTIIEDRKNGIMIEPKDREDLSKKILDILSQAKPQRQISNNATKTVDKRFSFDHSIAEVLKIYQGCM